MLHLNYNQVHYLQDYSNKYCAEGGTAIELQVQILQHVQHTTFNFVLRAVDAASNYKLEHFQLQSTELIVSVNHLHHLVRLVYHQELHQTDVLVVAGGGGGGNTVVVVVLVD
jgi:hypothetical protein